MAGCGGGGGGNTGTTATAGAVGGFIATASALATNDTATNPAAAFTVVQAAGVPVVASSGRTKVNFAVFSDGAVKPGLSLTNVSAVIAKLLPGTGGNPDQWQTYTHRTKAADVASAGGVYTAAVKATLTKPKLASTVQAYTDPKQTDPALAAGQLVYSADGYYTYTFSTDITNASQTNGVVFEPNRTHRVALQLSYTNAAGAVININPYFDFSFDANGNSVAVTDPAKTRKMADTTSCNSCHDKLSLHGASAVDTQVCVLCHNAGNVDPNSGNALTMATMVHSIHAGKLLNSTVATGGAAYTVGTRDFTAVGFPQDLRNCSVCHSGANPATPQGDNWKTGPSQQACLTCHANSTGSTWDTLHSAIAGQFVASGAPAKALTNNLCSQCHGAGSVISTERVHFNQAQLNAAKYKMNIESVVFNDTADHTGRSVSVKYFLSDPTNGNATYKLVTPDCTSTTTVSCTSTTQFGNLRFYLAYQSMVGQSGVVTEYSSYNNGGSTANAYAYQGKNDGSNHYTVSIPLPNDTATSVAFGTARVVSIGQIKEPLLKVQWATDPRPPVDPQVLIDVAVQHSYQELALSGTLQPRRTIVSTDKCNVCHGILGTTSASNTLATAFHSGARNMVEACVTCHDANRMSTTIMTNGSALNESYQFKRLIHGIHGGSQRTYPFTHNNAVVGVFNKDGTSATGGAPLASTVENFTAEVSWPGMRPGATINCNACHVNNSYQTDASPLGAVVQKDAGVTDPNLWKVISPKAATCTSCHDGLTSTGTTVISHVSSFGGAVFGNKTQAQLAALPRESCNDCHSNGGPKDVDIVHGLK